MLKGVLEGFLGVRERGRGLNAPRDTSGMPNKGRGLFWSESVKGDVISASSAEKSTERVLCAMQRLMEAMLKGIASLPVGLLPQLATFREESKDEHRYEAS